MRMNRTKCIVRLTEWVDNIPIDKFVSVFFGINRSRIVFVVGKYEITLVCHSQKAFVPGRMRLIDYAVVGICFA